MSGVVNVWVVNVLQSSETRKNKQNVVNSNLSKLEHEAVTCCILQLCQGHSYQVVRNALRIYQNITINNWRCSES